MPHYLADVGDGAIRGVHSLGVAMKEGIRGELFALVFCLFPQCHPDLASAQVLVDCLPTVTITIQRRQFFADLQACLQVPINGAAIGITHQQRVYLRGSVLAPLVPPIDF